MELIITIAFILALFDFFLVGRVIAALKKAVERNFWFSVHIYSPPLLRTMMSMTAPNFRLLFILSSPIDYNKKIFICQFALERINCPAYRCPVPINSARRQQKNGNLEPQSHNISAHFSVNLICITNTLIRNIRIRVSMVHLKEFESLAFGSVDQRSIQLS